MAMTAPQSAGRQGSNPPPRPVQYEATTPTLSLELKNPRKGWRGYPFATVQVGEYRPGRWIWATSYCLSSGEGAASPLGRWNDSPVHHECDSEESAVTAAFDHLLRQVDQARRPNDKAIPAIRAWAAARGRVAVQADLFPAERGSLI